VYCNRNCCNGRNSRIPNGYIAVHGVFVGWVIVRQATLEEYRGIKRAREIREIGMKNL